MSLKTKNEIANSSPWAWPQNLTWQNYELVLTNPNVSFMTGFFNTLMISTLATLGVVLSASMVAYPFARLQFRGRDRLFLVLISTMLLPGIVTMIPTYVMYKYVYWINTHYPLWVPAFLGGGAFNIFLIRQFYMGIPRELDEAAILDGSNHWTIFSRIIFPNATAVLTTVGIFSFMWSWRDFFSQLIYLNSPDKQTLEIVLRSYQALNDQQWDLLWPPVCWLCCHSC